MDKASENAHTAADLHGSRLVARGSWLVARGSYGIIVNGTQNNQSAAHECFAIERLGHAR
jgi:hypothetical protein